MNTTFLRRLQNSDDLLFAYERQIYNYEALIFNSKEVVATISNDEISIKNYANQLCMNELLFAPNFQSAAIGPVGKLLPTPFVILAH